jgi:hypothetical protein
VDARLAIRWTDTARERTPWCEMGYVRRLSSPAATPPGSLDFATTFVGVLREKIQKADQL